MAPMCDVVSEIPFAALGAIAARGTSNAAAGLSEMVGRPISIRSPELSVMKITQVPTLLANPEQTVVAVYLAMSGDVHGHILLLLSPSEAAGLVDMIMDMPIGTTKALGSLERSALGEVGNLTGSFFLNALADALDLTIQPSPPAVIVDMGAAIMDVPLLELAQSGDDALLINTVFTESDRQVQAIFLVMPDMPSLGILSRELQKRWPSS